MFLATFFETFVSSNDRGGEKKERKDRAYVDTRRSFEKGKKIVDYFFLFFYRGNYYDIIRGTVRRYGYYGSYCELWCYYVEQRHPRAVHTNAGTESEVKGLKRGCMCVCVWVGMCALPSFLAFLLAFLYTSRTSL